MVIEIPVWCKQAPNQNVDHKYLTDLEIEQLPTGIFFKRKAFLSRRRFIKAPLVFEDHCIVVELIDNRGYWQISKDECNRLRDFLADLFNENFYHLDDKQFLETLALSDYILTETEDLPKGNVHLPKTPEDVIRLYQDYTDMEEQGHFDDDSPDIERLHTIIEWVPSKTRVVDLGCNSGGFGIRLIKNKKCQVSGIDIAPILVKKAQSKGIEALHGFAEKTPFANSQFDVSLCCELLEHVLDPYALMIEARRITKPYGVLLGSVPHSEGEWGDNDIGYHLEHLRAFNESSIFELLSRSGFNLLDVVRHYYGNKKPQELLFRAVRRP